MTRPGPFERFYEEHVWTVYGFIGYRVASREEAEDLTQQTFERALKAWGRFDASRASEQTWILAIARNIVIDAYRRSREAGLEIEKVAEAGHKELTVLGPDATAIGIEPELEAALSRLSQRDREVVALRFGGDLKGAEIAELTGLTIANVQQILSRALRKLKNELTAVDAGS